MFTFPSGCRIYFNLLDPAGVPVQQELLLARRVDAYDEGVLIIFDAKAAPLSIVSIQNMLAIVPLETVGPSAP